jgi:hypothetical protein
MRSMIQKHKFSGIAGSVVLLLVTIYQPILSQEASVQSFLEISDHAEEKYGPDMVLISGEKYHYPYRAALGNPFLTPSGNDDASVQLNGVVYENQRVKYDIHNQLIVLEFNDMTGASRNIILRDELLDQFILDDKLFKKYAQEGSDERFGQVIYEGVISCFYFWKKRYSVDSKVGQNQYSFSDPIRQSFLMTDGQVIPYNGKKSFLNCFPAQERMQIKAIMKKNRIKIRKESDTDMRLLLENINQIHQDEN